MSHALKDMQNCPPSAGSGTAVPRKRTPSNSRAQTPATLKKPADSKTPKTPENGQLLSPPAFSHTRPVQVNVPFPAVPHTTVHIFRNDWARTLHDGHPNRQTGLDILDTLLSNPYLSVPKSAKYAYNGLADPRRPPDLVRITQQDLDTLDFAQCRIITDQRYRDPQLPRLLQDALALRMALSMGQPVAFNMPSTASRPTLRLDAGYKPHRAGSTIVAGAGALIFTRPSAEHPLVLTQTLGQCVLLDFPTTPENRSACPDDARDVFAWARAQPGLTVRVLRPGEHVFLPPLQSRCMLALGCENSSFSATMTTYVTHDAHPHRQREEHKPAPTTPQRPRDPQTEADERERKRLKTG